MVANLKQSQLDDVDTHWQKAQTRWKNDRSKLLHSDGSKIFSDKQHASQQQALDDELSDYADDAQAGYQAIMDACDSVKLATYINPLLQIHDSTQRAEALYSRVWIEDDCKEMTLPELTNQLLAMALHGSKVECLLYVRYGGRRLRSSTNSTDEANLGWLECRAALAQLEAQLDGGEREKNRKAAETVKQQAERQQMRVNIDLSKLIGGLRVDAGERSMVAKTF